MSKMNFKIWSPLTSIDEELLSRVRLAHVCDREVFLVTNDDEVFTCGTNKNGCLGLEDTASRFALEAVSTLHRKRVKGFVFGGTTNYLFVIAHTFTGTAYMWGKNHGTGSATLILKPTLMDQLTKKVVEVACGYEHCLFLNIDGEVLGWGGNTYGQLGINSQNRTAVPVKIEGLLTGKIVVKISCGSYFSTAVLDSGEIFTWGSNDYGQLGLNDGTAYFWTPKKVTNLNDVVMKKIICGSTYVLALNDICELYVWGSNAYGELGLGDTVNRLAPVKNEAVGRVINIAALSSFFTSAALTENLKVYMWGDCAGLKIRVPKETRYESLNEVFANFSKPSIMHKSMTRQSGYLSVNESIRNAFEDKVIRMHLQPSPLAGAVNFTLMISDLSLLETSDLIIMAEGKEIFVHRTILRLRSDYFRALLQEHWVDEAEKCITISQSYNAIYSYLEYLYTGELKAEPKLALELLALADEYNDRLLKKLCEKTIQHGITIDNVASLYAIALKLDGKKLLKCCLSFAANHMSELVDTSGFDEWDVKTMKEFFRECRKRKLFRS